MFKDLVLCIYFACIYVMYSTWMLSANRNQKRAGVPWNCSFRQLWAFVWVLGDKLGTSARTESTLAAKSSLQAPIGILEENNSLCIEFTSVYLPEMLMSFNDFWLLVLNYWRLLWEKQVGCMYVYTYMQFFIQTLQVILTCAKLRIKANQNIC